MKVAITKEQSLQYARLLVAATADGADPPDLNQPVTVWKLMTDTLVYQMGGLLVAETVPAGELIYPNGSPITGYAQRSRAIVGWKDKKGFLVAQGEVHVRAENVLKRFMCCRCRCPGAILALEEVPLGQEIFLEGIRNIEAHMNRRRLPIAECLSCHCFDKLSGTNAEPASDQDSELLAELFRQMRHSKAVQPPTVVV